MGAALNPVGAGKQDGDTPRNATLLLAEDDDLLRRVFARTFRDEGYEVEVAEDGGAALSAHAGRVVLEITERAGLDEVKDARSRIESLKRMGYRIAVDDLGAGYAGLNSFAQLEPHIVKLDMALVRGVHEAPTKRKLIQSIILLCRDLGIEAVAEGVESVAERDALAQLGCTLLQGYLFAKPDKGFPLPKF